MENKLNILIAQYINDHKVMFVVILFMLITMLVIVICKPIVRNVIDIAFKYVGYKVKSTISSFNQSPFNNNKMQINELSQGLQEATQIIDFVFKTVEGFKLAKADGVVNFADLQYAFPLLDAGNVALKGAELVPAAWKVASDEEKLVVYNYFAEKFDLADDVVEAKVEKAVRAGYLLMDLFI